MCLSRPYIPCARPQHLHHRCIIYFVFASCIHLPPLLCSPFSLVCLSIHYTPRFFAFFVPQGILFLIRSIITAHFVYKSLTASDEDVTFFSSSVCHEGRWLLFCVQVAVELKPHLFAVKFLFL